MERFVENPDFLQDIFLEESWKNIDKIDGFIESKANLEEFEVSEEEVNSLYRTMHSIKGSAAMMGYPVISETAHAAEDLFSYLREENSPAQKDLQQILAGRWCAVLRIFLRMWTVITSRKAPVIRSHTPERENSAFPIPILKH